MEANSGNDGVVCSVDVAQRLLLQRAGAQRPQACCESGTFIPRGAGLLYFSLLFANNLYQNLDLIYAKVFLIML